MSTRLPAVADSLSEGEELLEKYLTSRALTSQRHPRIGKCNPDFRVVHPKLGSLVFEVYEPHLSLPNTAGAFDSLPTLQRAFSGRKRRQISAVKEEGLPYIGVVARTNMAIPVDPLMMSAAMFGRVSVRLTVPAEMDGEVEAGKFVFGGGARLQPTQFRGVSAVAIVREFNPTQPVFDRAAHEEALLLGPTATAGDYLAAIQPVQQALVSSGAFDPAAQAVRLIVLHNPFAQHPLSIDFGGPHDTQWHLWEQDGNGVYGEFVEGHLGGQVTRAFA